MRPASRIFLLVSGLVLGACNGDEGRPSPIPDARTSVIQAAERTREAGPARIKATLRSGRVRYQLDGRLDPAGGYRLCADISAAPSDFLRGRLLWLDGRAGTYGTLTSRSRRCERRALWFDDHPPTLELHVGEDVPQAPTLPGGEDVLHAALVALTGLENRTVTAARARACGRSHCYRTEIDFDALDRKPRQRDEDGWTVRPFLRSLARHHATLRVSPGGFVDRLSLSAPGPTPRGRKSARLALDLSAFGEERSVPLVHALAIE